MYFTSVSPAPRTLSVLPLLGVSLLPVLLLLTMVCFSLSREEESVRLPSGTLPRPPRVAQSPVISVRLSGQGTVALGGQRLAALDLPAAWQRERAALQLLGFEPPQATVIVRADRDVPTEKVRRLIEQAQEAGFAKFALRPVESPGPDGSKP